METGLLEVLNGLRRELSLTRLDEKTEEYREYTCLLRGDFIDIRGGRPELHDPDSYIASQVFGEHVRASDWSGIAYDSVRDPGYARAGAGVSRQRRAACARFRRAGR